MSKKKQAERHDQINWDRVSKKTRKLKSPGKKEKKHVF